MSSGITNLSVQVDHSDDHSYTFTKNFHGVTINYVSGRGNKTTNVELFIPQNSVPAITHALNIISQNPE